MRLSLCGSGHSEGTGPQILTIAVMHEARSLGGLPGMYRLFQGIQNEACMGRSCGATNKMRLGRQSG